MNRSVDPERALCQSSFRFSNRTVTVTMTSPAIGPGRVNPAEPFDPTAKVPRGWYWPLPDVDQPTVVHGFVFPGTFVVTGLDVDVSFTTATRVRDDHDGGPIYRGDVFLAFDTVTVRPTVPPVDAAIPFRKLLEHAAIASGAVGRFDPATGRVEELAWGPLTKRELARIDVLAVTGTGRRRRTAMTDDFLRSVADTFAAAEYGDRYAAVMVQHHGSRSAVTNWVAECRRRGFLSDVDDNDGRKAFRKGTT